jgi:hypothetical protein
MPDQYDPKQLERFRKILNQIPGLRILWFSGLEQAPWFETISDQELLIQITSNDELASLKSLINLFSKHAVQGDYLLRFNHIGNIPWARVSLSSPDQWLPALVSYTHNASLVSPNYRTSFHYVEEAGKRTVYIAYHDNVDIDEDN